MSLSRHTLLLVVPSQHTTMPPVHTRARARTTAQTCTFDIVLANGGAHVSAVAVKVECSVEGGSSSVLYDNGASPLQQLLQQQQQALRVATDIKEQGLLTIVASAVYTGVCACVRACVCECLCVCVCVS
jgi:hypothetical protein